MAYKHRKITTKLPQYVSIIIDDSWSMSDEGKCKHAVDACYSAILAMVNATNLVDKEGSKQYFNLRITKFGDEVEVITKEINGNDPDPRDISKSLLEDNIKGQSGQTNMVDALQDTYEWLKEKRKSMLEASPAPLVLLLTDGMPYNSDNPEIKKLSAEVAQKIPNDIKFDEANYPTSKEEESNIKVHPTNAKVICIAIGGKEKNYDPKYLWCNIATKSKIPNLETNLEEKINEYVTLYMETVSPDELVSVVSIIIGSIVSRVTNNYNSLEAAVKDYQEKKDIRYDDHECEEMDN